LGGETEGDVKRSALTQAEKRDGVSGA
jgi:hypothetical protein